jgi:hypothetical protein
MDSKKELYCKYFSMIHYLKRSLLMLGRNKFSFVGFEVFTAVIMNNAAQSDESPQTIRRNMPPQSSEKKSKPSKKLQ